MNERPISVNVIEIRMTPKISCAVPFAVCGNKNNKIQKSGTKAESTNKKDIKKTLNNSIK
jgi:hypothetical protein